MIQDSKVVPYLVNLLNSRRRRYDFTYITFPKKLRTCMLNSNVKSGFFIIVFTALNIQIATVWWSYVNFFQISIFKKVEGM